MEIYCFEQRTQTKSATHIPTTKRKGQERKRQRGIKSFALRNIGCISQDLVSFPRCLRVNTNSHLHVFVLIDEAGTCSCPRRTRASRRPIRDCSTRSASHCKILGYTRIAIWREPSGRTDTRNGIPAARDASAFGPVKPLHMTPMPQSYLQKSEAYPSVCIK